MQVGRFVYIPSSGLLQGITLNGSTIFLYIYRATSTIDISFEKFLLFRYLLLVHSVTHLNKHAGQAGN